MNSRWSDNEIEIMRKLDLELAKLVSEYVGGKWHKDKVFIPTRDNLERIKGSTRQYKDQVNKLPDEFWRRHFLSVFKFRSIHCCQNC